MKRFTAILFLFVLLFNLCGYRLVIYVMQQQHHEAFTARLDREAYADEDLISIKTALSLPYYNASMDFERIDGSITIDGVLYNYVKRRIVADSLEVLCLPNATKQKLQTAKWDFFKLSNDLQQPEGAKKSTNITKVNLPEFCEAAAAYSLQALHTAKQKYPRINSSLKTLRAAQVPEHPPETMRTCS